MVRITERDLRLIAKSAAAQWLTTSQVQRLFFRDSTVDAVRKRLRKLSDGGYLYSAQPHCMVEMLHTVGRKGQALLADKGWEVRTSRRVPDHIEHCIGVNDLRIAVESVPWRVPYFFAHWELGQFAWRHAVIPDAIFCVEAPPRLTCMAEYDRGTEGSKVLLKKLHQYGWLLAAFPFDAVLVIADSEQFARRLCNTLTGSHRFAIGVCHAQHLRDAGLEGRIFVVPQRPGRVSLADLAAADDE